MKHLELKVFSVSRDGWKCYLSLKDFQAAIDWDCTSSAHSKWFSRRMVQWKLFLTSLNVTDTHILRPDSSRGTELKIEAWHASFPATLAWLAMLARRSQSQKGKKHLTYMSTGLLRMYNRGGKFNVQHAVLGSYENSTIPPLSKFSTSGDSLQLVDGVPPLPQDWSQKLAL
eukprot:597011-Amphidinium_carterae.1